VFRIIFFVFCAAALASDLRSSIDVSEPGCLASTHCHSHWHTVVFGCAIERSDRDAFVSGSLSPVSVGRRVISVEAFVHRLHVLGISASYCKILTAIRALEWLRVTSIFKLYPGHKER